MKINTLQEIDGEVSIIPFNLIVDKFGLQSDIISEIWKDDQG